MLHASQTISLIIAYHYLSSWAFQEIPLQLIIKLYRRSLFPAFSKVTKGVKRLLWFCIGSQTYTGTLRGSLGKKTLQGLFSSTWFSSIKGNCWGGIWDPSYRTTAVSYECDKIFILIDSFIDGGGYQRCHRRLPSLHGTNTRPSNSPGYFTGKF